MNDDVTPLELHILDRMLRDLDGPGLRTVEEYEQTFAGHKHLVRACHQRLTADAPPASGDDTESQLGPFALLKVAGRGGQGTVWRARDTRLDRIVAVKVLSTQLSLTDDETGERLRRRFEREAIAAARLDDPGICGVHEVGEQDGVPWIAMQWVPGTSLDRCVSECQSQTDNPGPVWHEALGTNSSDRVRDRATAIVKLLAAVARSVHSAHLAGLVHRDLKPGNLMLTPDGRSVVLDFGLALDNADNAETLTLTGDAMGSPAYMAPEQLDAKAVDRRCDVYALGVTLYECLALRRPFDEGTRERLFRAIRLGERPALARVVPSLPSDLVHVVECATDPNPDRRYDSASELADDLDRVLSGNPVRARVPGLGTRLVRWTRSSPTIAVALLAVLLLAATVVALQHFESLKLVKKNDELDRRNREAMWSTHLSSLRLAALHLDRAELQEASEALEASPIKHRGFVWHHLKLDLDESSHELTKANMLAASSNCEFLACLQQDNVIEVRDGTSGRELHSWVDASEKVVALTISDAGDVIALARNDHTVAFLDAATGKELRKFGPFRGWPLELVLHPEGEVVAVRLQGERSHAIRTLDRVNGKILPEEPLGGQGVAFLSRDRIITSDPRDGVRIVELQTNASTAHIPHSFDRQFDKIAASPDGRRVAVGHWQDGRIEIHDMASGEIVRCTDKHRGRISGLRFDATGNQLVSRDTTQMTCVWTAYSGNHVRSFRGIDNLPVVRPDRSGLWGLSRKSVRWFDLEHRPSERRLGPGHLFALSADGATVHVVTGPSITSFDIETGQVRGFVRRRVEYSISAISSTQLGEREVVAIGYQNGSVELIDATNFRHLQTIPWTATWRGPTNKVRKSGVNSVRFSPTGQRLMVGHVSGAVRVLRAADGEQVALARHPVGTTVIAFDSTGGSVYVQSNSNVLRLSASDPSKVLEQVYPNKSPLAQAVSPDNRWLSVAELDGKLEVWDLKDKTKAVTTTGSGWNVQNLTFDSSGTRIASTGMDRTLRIWDRATGDALLVRAFGSNLSQPLFHPDGSRLLYVREGVRILESQRPSDELQAKRHALQRIEREAHRVLGNAKVDHLAKPWLLLDEVDRTIDDPEVRLTISRLLAEGSPHPMPSALVARQQLLEPKRGTNHQWARAWIEFACHRWPQDAGFAATRALERLRAGEFDQARDLIRTAEVLAADGRDGSGFTNGVKAWIALASGDVAGAEKASTSARAANGYEYALPRLLAEVGEQLLRKK